MPFILTLNSQSLSKSSI